MAGKQLEKRMPTLEDAIKASPVDPVDEPSVGWGWHGHATKTFRVAAVFFAVFLLLMIIDNKEGVTGVLYLIGFAVAVLAFLVVDFIRRRSRWNR